MAKLTGQQLITKAGKYHQAGKFSQAEKIYRRLLNANPNDLTLLRILGMLERDRKNLKAAVDWFVLAKQVSADDPIILAELALTLEQGGNPDKAMKIATEAINSKPTDISIAIFFAKMCLARGHATRAAKAIEGALDSDPNNPEAWHLLSMAANSTGTLPVPLHYAKKLIQLQPQDAQPYATLATSHRLNGNLDEALAWYDRSLERDRSFSEAIAGKAEVLESLGRTEEAEKILINAPNNNSVLVALAKVRIARKLGKQDRAIQAIDSVMNQQLSPYHQSNLLMHKGRVLEELKKYDEAWKCWEDGNQLHGGTFPLTEHIKLVDTIIDACNEKLPQQYTQQDPAPIFIVGMFRSGTTLLEQILCAHQKIDAAGEVDQMLRFVSEKPYPECIVNPNPKWRKMYIERLGSNNSYCTDKMPMNYLHIGLIKSLFPDAKIIHTSRNPLDTCVSCFANSFSTSHAYTSNLKELTGVYKQYQRIMKHWEEQYPGQIHEVPYESIVNDLESTIKGTLEHIGVDFEPACLEFYNVRRIAVTPSADQVRKPIYSSSIGRHNHFAKHLNELIDLQ
ncbi:MAG: tetratricopeptide (TPR) repeat protein [Phycisphaerales bacterium]|jgi:tetratricopeptide (TPR) repeat protein